MYKKCFVCLIRLFTNIWNYPDTLRKLTLRHASEYFYSSHLVGGSSFIYCVIHPKVGSCRHDNVFTYLSRKVTFVVVATVCLRLCNNEFLTLNLGGYELSFICRNKKLKKWSSILLSYTLFYFSFKRTEITVKDNRGRDSVTDWNPMD